MYGTGPKGRPRHVCDMNDKLMSWLTLCKVEILMMVMLTVFQNDKCYGHGFFIFCFTDFFHNKLGSEDEIKNKNKIHLDHFPIELKLKETRFCVSFNFNSIGKWSE